MDNRFTRYIALTFNVLNQLTSLNLLVLTAAATFLLTIEIQRRWIFIGKTSET